MSIKPSSEALRIAGLVGEQDVGEEIDATTDHAWLVVLGYFAQALGLVVELAKVPIEQRKGRDHTPQKKLIEFLVGILGGIEHLQDLNLAEQPIAKDPTVAEAWAQAIFAHYSGVSRTLDASDEDTLAAVIEVLRSISRPFIDAAVLETIKQYGRLTVDVDLTGRKVSSTSTDYPDADFGWMDDGVSKGYQAAVTSLVCERWTRLMLTLQRYAGRTKSAECLQEAVQQVEQLLGVRPKRRVWLIQGASSPDARADATPGRCPESHSGSREKALEPDPRSQNRDEDPSKHGDAPGSGVPSSGASGTSAL